MTITEKYIEIIRPSLSPCQKHQFKDGTGYKLACPFCRDVQKRESKSKEKCASLYPVEGSYTFFFSCNRGLNGGVQGVQSCNHTMGFSTFLKSGISLSTGSSSERRNVRRTYQPGFPDPGIRADPQVSVLINDSVLLPRLLSCPSLGTS